MFVLAEIVISGFIRVNGFDEVVSYSSACAQPEPSYMDFVGTQLRTKNRKWGKGRREVLVARQKTIKKVRSLYARVDSAVASRDSTISTVDEILFDH